MIYGVIIISGVIIGLLIAILIIVTETYLDRRGSTPLKMLTRKTLEALPKGGALIEPRTQAEELVDTLKRTDRDTPIEL